MLRRRAVVLPALLSTLVLLVGAGPSPGYATSSGNPASVSKSLFQGGDTDIADLNNEYALMRSLPGNHASAAALLAARQQAAALPLLGGGWREQTNVPYNAQPAGYNDPVWSNAQPAPGAGWSLVGGRITALAASGNTIYAGTADGGVWSSNDNGGNWTPLSDGQPSLSVGALAVNPDDHSLWVGTGEANTNADSYLGTGVYRLSRDGSLRQVGGGALIDRQVYQLLFDGVGGVYAATNRGLFKTSADAGGTWATVLMPDAADTFPPYTNHITTVAVQPGTNGQQVVAVDGWRSAVAGTPSDFNGFYASTDGGQHFSPIQPIGNLDGSDIGRTTMAYASDGKLYAVIESPAALNAGSPNATNLKGLYVSRSGDPRGPWKLLADSPALQASGSALAANISPNYRVGIQSWYNQVLAIDPANPDHVYVSLEEAFQSNDGGKTFTTASPYWNFGLACNPNCPNTTHPDQHALLITGGRVFIGNDGGVYSRPLSATGYGHWRDLNATLHNLQFYDARAGTLGGGVAYWGGMQDNGSGLIPGHGATMVEPAGGDGFDVIVDPANANRAVGEYTNLTTYLTTDGGHSFVTASPSCVAQANFFGATRADCDPNARFWAPFAADKLNINHWIAGGEFVWETNKGWATRCDPTKPNCDWSRVFDTGAGNAVTGVSGAGATEYAAWVHGSGNPSGSFHVGIATNFGGTWHQLNVSSLPNRFIAGVTLDAANPAHVYAIFNGYSRRWIPGGGQGVVFESRDGGATWSNMTGNLPDAPGDALVIVGDQLVLATDVGVFTAAVGGTSWSRLGHGLPNASANDVTLGPDGRTVVAGTHGRGIWTLSLDG
jgi:sugar lactone lactonase YvrE